MEILQKFVAFSEYMNFNVLQQVFLHVSIVIFSTHMWFVSSITYVCFVSLKSVKHGEKHNKGIAAT